MTQPFVGQIAMFGFTFAPRGWAACAGQVMPITQNQTLYALLGTTYGGDGRTSFNLPDLRGRLPMHFDTNSGIYQGRHGGAESAYLTVNQLPPHTHTATTTGLTATANVSIDVKGSSGASTTTSPDGAVSAIPERGSNAYIAGSGNVTMQTQTVQVPETDITGSITVDNAGNGQSYSIMQPYLPVNFCISLQGLFPSRN